MPLARAVQIAACSAAALLFAMYGGARMWSAYASNQGLAAMRQVRAQYAAGPAADSPAAVVAKDGTQRNSLAVTQPDTTIWSPKRLTEYHSSAAPGMMPVAVLRVPRLKLEVPVYEGTSDASLNRGAGRIAGTADIGSNTGNIGIAAHRDGFFRILKSIGVGDAIFLDTVATTRQYRVSRLDIVEPGNVSVLDPTPGSTVTLVTCYPFYYVGSAPKRFIVHAQLR